MSLPNCSPIAMGIPKLSEKQADVPVQDLELNMAFPKVTGSRHLFSALGYSLDGAGRLLTETAFRHELVLAFGNAVLFAYVGARAPDYLIMVMLMLALFAFEALNTAIEEIIDRISPEWSHTGRHAKNLGSFAVLCMLGSNAFYTFYIVITRLW